MGHLLYILLYILNIIIRSLFKSREFNRANYGEITDCYSFSPKQWHNFSLSFFSFSPFIIFSHKSDFLSSKIHLWDFVSKLRAYKKKLHCNVRCHALLQDQLRRLLLFYVGNNYLTFMFRLKLLLCLFKKKKRCNLKKQRCNLKSRYSYIFDSFYWYYLK